jgi:hypothetical protein
MIMMMMEIPRILHSCRASDDGGGDDNDDDGDTKNFTEL